MFRKMNLVAFGFLLICCNAWAFKIAFDNFLDRSIFNTNIEDLFEQIRSILRNGDTSLGLPVLDPYIAEEKPIKLNARNLNIEAYLPYAKVDGLSSYNVNKANFNLFGMRLNVDLSWPLVAATANYSTLKGNAFGVEVYGNGEANATAHDINCQAQINLKLKGTHIQIKRVPTKISLRALDLYVTGLYNNEKLSETISKTISDEVPKLLAKEQKIIDDTVNIIIDNLNKFLSTITLKELMGLVRGLA